MLIFRQDQKVGALAHDLGEKLHRLTQQCSAFRDRVHHFVDFHKRNRKTLQHHMQLVELLEVPQLVDACARNGFHEEALELANFVNGLERRHLLAAEVRSVDGKMRGGSGVVQSIVEDVHATLIGLRQQLLLLLTENASLPKEMQILGTLRKLDSLLVDRQIAVERYDNEVLAAMTDQERERLRSHLVQFFETRLQMDFLEARTVWLERLAEKALLGASGAPGEQLNPDVLLLTMRDAPEGPLANRLGPVGATAHLGPYGKAIELLEVHRTSWFSIVTQYSALFGDDGGVDESFTASAVLGAWATRQVHLLLCDLQGVLPLIQDGASLRTVLEQALFFASRMGEVGCDFAGILVPLVKQTLVDKFSKDLRSAGATFKEILSSERLVIEIDGAKKEQVIGWWIADCILRLAGGGWAPI